MVTTKVLLDNSKKLGRDNSDVDFDNLETPRYDLSQKKLSFKGYAKGSKDNLYNYPLPKDLLEHRVKVDCDCYDYTFGGALKGNLNNDCALYTDAKLTKYKKKTDRPENNPDNIPYACKHILTLIKRIVEAAE